MPSASLVQVFSFLLIPDQLPPKLHPPLPLIFLFLFVFFFLFHLHPSFPPSFLPPLPAQPLLAVVSGVSISLVEILELHERGIFPPGRGCKAEQSRQPTKHTNKQTNKHTPGPVSQRVPLPASCGPRQFSECEAMMPGCVFAEGGGGVVNNR